MSDDEEIRTIYTMRYNFEHNNEIYMGWTSDSLDQTRAMAGEETCIVVCGQRV